MAFGSDGVWKQEDAGVANRIAKITSGNSDYMKSARTSGMQTANRRGLGNSSMAVRAAEGAAIDRAAPIASQEAQQIHGHNMAEHEGGIRTDQLGMQLAAAEREAMGRFIADMSGQRYGALANTLVNPDIPGSARSAVQGSINSQHQQALNYLQRLYGVRLSDAGFATGGGAAGGGGSYGGGFGGYTPTPGINISGGLGSDNIRAVLDRMGWQ